MKENQHEKKLEGVVPALITPVDERGKIDLGLLEKHVSYLSSAGVHGFFMNSTTGEGPYLTREEKMEVFKIVREVVGAKQFLCVACIQPSTSLTIDEIGAYEHLEPDYIVAVVPFYYEVSQKVIAQHYREIAKNSPFPVIMYNIPQCTHNPMELQTILELSRIENIRGIKDSSGDFISFTRGLMSDFPDQFMWFLGEDRLDGPALLLGAHGIVTGLGNVWIEPYVEVFGEAKRGNISKVNESQMKINKLYEIISVAGGKVISSIKAGVSILGRSEKWMKMSSMVLSDEEISSVQSVLTALGLL